MLELATLIAVLYALFHAFELGMRHFGFRPSDGDMRIRHHEDLGFTAEVFEYGHYAIISRTCCQTVSHAYAMRIRSDCFHQTEQEARDTMNKFHRVHYTEPKTVFTTGKAA